MTEDAECRGGDLFRGSQDKAIVHVACEERGLFVFLPPGVVDAEPCVLYPSDCYAGEDGGYLVADGGTVSLRVTSVLSCEYSQGQGKLHDSWKICEIDAVDVELIGSFYCSSKGAKFVGHLE